MDKQTDRRELLEVLKRELAFLESGGYEFARKQDPDWRPPFYFEDSPTCFYKWCGSQGERDCSGCILAELVPTEAQVEAFPCRHIPLNAEGMTLEAYYKHGTQPELERNLKRWLLARIEELEQALTLRDED